MIGIKGPKVQYIQPNRPVAKITATLIDNSFKVADFSGVFDLKDYQGNSLISQDEVTISITTKDTNTYIGSGTFQYGANLVSDLPLSSDSGFDNFIQPYFSGLLQDSGSFVFDKYGAVSFWNLTNGGLAGINQGEDWVVTIKAKDVSEGFDSINTDNTAEFIKLLKYRNAPLVISSASGTAIAYGLGLFASIPNEGFVWDNDITFDYNNVQQPDVSVSSYILSNARAQYILGNFGSSLADYFCTGSADNWQDFQLPPLYNEKLTQMSTGFNYGGNLSGVDQFSATSNDVTVRFRLGTRDFANQAQEWEIYVSDIPGQDPLLGTKIFSLINPPEGAQASPVHTFTGGEGIYRLLTRHIDSGNTEAYGDHELLIFSI